MKKLYSESYERMRISSFILRSWNSNDEELRYFFIGDNGFVQHDSNLEMFLGYKFNVVNYSILLNNVNDNQNETTKRKIFAETSKGFDPLDLVLSITVRDKFLMRNIW